MARIETVLSVFVASPGEVADERKRLERVVDELNFVWSRECGLRLELVKWETHAYSDRGTDAQDVINKQLDEFDTFSASCGSDSVNQPVERSQAQKKSSSEHASDTIKTPISSPCHVLLQEFAACPAK